MAKQESDLGKIRDRIDQLDEDIQRLINERAACAQDVARVKAASGDDDAGFYRPEREAQVLRTVIERNAGPLSSEEMARLFREIMSACLALEKPMRIAFLGPQGTFTHDAALKHFGHSVEVAQHGAIDEVFRDVEAGLCHYGVVPVESSMSAAHWFRWQPPHFLKKTFHQEHSSTYPNIGDSSHCWLNTVRQQTPSCVTPVLSRSFV